MQLQQMETFKEEQAQDYRKEISTLHAANSSKVQRASITLPIIVHFIAVCALHNSSHCIVCHHPQSEVRRYVQIQELDAEIKHAFAELECNELARQELQAKGDSLAAQLDDALQQLQDTESKLHANCAELQDARKTHKEAAVSLLEPFLQCGHSCRATSVPAGAGIEMSLI